MRLLEKLAGIAPTPVEPLQNLTWDADSYSACTSAINSESSSSNNTKQIKLLPEDKEKLEKKMWKLSTGTIVEKKMEEFAKSCTYEQ